MLKKKNKKKIGKPPAFVYSLAYFFVNPIFRLKYKVNIDRSGLKDLKGPALVLCPHLSNNDHILTGLTLFPHRPTFVVSHHFNTSRLIRFLFKWMRTIEKRMFCSDGGSVLNIMRAIKEGNVVLLFPEGRLTWYGRSLNIVDGTAELVKKLGVNVYSVTSNGAGLTWPKWAKERRKGKINIETAKILSSDEIKNLSVKEIEEKVSSFLKHDEEKVLPETRFTAKKTALGLDGIVWKCPICGAEDKLVCNGNEIRCTECQAVATVDGRGKIVGFNGEKGIESVADWYEYCASTVDISKPYSSECEVDCEDKNGYMAKGVGKGRATIDSEKFSFDGEVNGNKLSFEISTSVIKAFPISVGDHFDAYYDNNLYLFRPLPNPNKSVVFVAYLDKVTASKRD